MDLILFHHDEYDHLYNCSFYNIDQIPLENRQHKALGWIFIALFFIFELLYIPCIIAITKHLRYASFKFMFYIGIVDIVALWIAGLQSGYFAINGSVFCSNPTFIYVSGIFALGFWISESTAAMMLALNRCVEVWSPKLAKLIYGGKMSWLWLIPVNLYAFCTVYFGKIPVFSSIYMAWFFDPHVGYADDFGKVYHNFVASSHNLVLCGGLASLYLGFCVTLLYKRRHFEAQYNVRNDKMPFVQVFLITIVNMIASALYVFMQFVPISGALIILGQFTWILAHGMPPLIYITLNRTIRSEIHRWTLKWIFRKNPISIASLQSFHNIDYTVKVHRTEHGIIIQNNSLNMFL
ncbi:serpentine type 7TM GPCR chemoreceptor srt domain-containing protein [Ditylenchus destructor]|uniref:Serpentine type 7TM GPCR chemoreceptor srt domain-containing protein n=1 Tax=Ditylenchus destructor TaxID=166010 RepID=A0AAD4R1K5_9BILA|nr:serpentine type 7TM GPCR chemoreceptor srt domain-containing protein [Ditylenchus destructor]